MPMSQKPISQATVLQATALQATASQRPISPPVATAPKAKKRPVVTLRLNKEFRTLYYHGASFVHPLLVTYVRKNRAGAPRVGITTGKKAGGAVQRNRCRRIIREAWRALLPRLNKPVDVVFVARAHTAEAKTPDIRRAMEQHLKQAGVL